jgi:prolyl 4-hydroxylase
MRVFTLLFFVSSLYAGFSRETLSSRPRIYLLTDFLTSEECDHMIKEALPYLQRSTVIDESKAHEGKLDWRRSSQGMFFPPHPRDRILRRVERRIAEVTGLPVENGEAIQVLRYQVGGEYQPHFDYFSSNNPGGAASLMRGGQRVATLIMYLNTPEAGGETIFPQAKITVLPKKGTAVLFYNCTPAGEVDPMTLHGGAPVKAGEKWIATKWLRMNVFQ